MSDNFDRSVMSSAFKYLNFESAPIAPHRTTSTGGPKSRAHVSNETSGAPTKRSESQTQFGQGLPSQLLQRTSGAPEAHRPEFRAYRPMLIAPRRARLLTPNPMASGGRQPAESVESAVRTMFPEVVPIYESTRAPAAHRMQFRSAANSAPTVLELTTGRMFHRQDQKCSN
jgi:hypothetical protein